MKFILISIISIYRRHLAPYRVPACKYCPSCSEYAIEAIKKDGVAQGALKTLWRLIRCNPFSKGGYDPA